MKPAFKNDITLIKALKNGDCVIELLEKSSQLPPLDMRVLQSKAACNNTGMLDFF